MVWNGVNAGYEIFKILFVLGGYMSKVNFISKILESDFKKYMLKKEYLFNGWIKEYEKDTSEEVFSFQKDEIIIQFREDLREHVVNFRILHPYKRMINIYDRKPLYVSESLDSADLLISLENLNKRINEKTEIDAYIKFLIKNNII